MDLQNTSGSLRYKATMCEGDPTDEIVVHANTLDGLNKKMHEAIKKQWNVQYYEDTED